MKQFFAMYFVIGLSMGIGAGIATSKHSDNPVEIVVEGAVIGTLWPMMIARVTFDSNMAAAVSLGLLDEDEANP